MEAKPYLPLHHVQLEVHWPVCLTTKMLEEPAIVIAVTGYGHIIQNVAELINEVYTLDIHLSIAQLGHFKYRGGIEDGDLGLHRQADLAIATAISGAEGRVTDQVLTGSQELWQATQLTDVLIEIQHTLIGISQDPAIGVLVDELIMYGLFHLGAIEPK